MGRAALLFLLTAVACSKAGGPASAADEARAVVERDLPEEGLVVQEVDLDADGKPEIWNYYRERADGSRVRVRKEVDLNFDGKIDVLSIFDADGALQTEQMDSDFDGTLDWTDHYKDGERFLSEVDSDFDGEIDVTSHYAAGADGVVRLERKERDTDGDGRTDVWERFDASGQMVTRGRDTDGDGKMDERDE